MSRRTTVTFDDDVFEQLIREARGSGESFRSTLNRIVRRGLHPPRLGRRKPFKVEGPFARGKPGVSFDNIEELLDQIEGPWRR